jgi:hypothetical protein
LRPLRAEGEEQGELDVRPPIGEQRGFHWNCYIALLKSEGAPSAEAATWKGDGQESNEQVKQCSKSGL